MRMAKTKYGQLVKQLTFREGTMSKANAREMVFMKGDDLEGFDLNFILGVYDQTGDWAPGWGAHAHPFDECLLFAGLDYDNPNDLGAEIEIAMGDGDGKEIHVFDTPTVVIAPAGLVHCPLITRKVDKPYSFSAISLNTAHETTWLG